MREVHLAELRDSWPAWAGVSLGFIMTSASVSLAALVLASGLNAVETGALELTESAAFTFNAAQNAIFCILIGAAVIGASTGLVVESRRGSLARLALTGATPGQIRGTLMSQLVVVTLVCAVLGNLLAVLALDPMLAFMAGEREAEGLTAPPPAVYAPWAVLLGTGVTVVTALVGGYAQARAASRIPPVEALREAARGRTARMNLFRWTGGVLAALAVVGTVAATWPVSAIRGKETVSNLMMLYLATVVLMAVLVALLAPALTGPLTRAWTRLVPTSDPVWQITRATAIARSGRLAASVTPVAMTIGLLIGTVVMGAMINGTLVANDFGYTLSASGPETMLIFLALPLAVAMAGGVGSLIMMSRQRDAELALSGIVGTTPAQRVAMPLLEGVIITVTGLVLGSVMVGTAMVTMVVGIPRAGFVFGIDLSPWPVVLAALTVLTITVAATTLPTLAALRRPEPKVIARLVAE